MLGSEDFYPLKLEPTCLIGLSPLAYIMQEDSNSINQIKFTSRSCIRQATYLRDAQKFSFTKFIVPCYSCFATSLGYPTMQSYCGAPVQAEQRSHGSSKANCHTGAYRITTWSRVDGLIVLGGILGGAASVRVFASINLLFFLSYWVRILNWS